MNGSRDLRMRGNAKMRNTVLSCHASLRGDKQGTRSMVRYGAKHNALDPEGRPQVQGRAPRCEEGEAVASTVVHREPSWPSTPLPAAMSAGASSVR